MKKITLLILVLILHLIFVDVCTAGDDKPCGVPCGKPTPWAEFNVVELKMTAPNEHGYEIWNIEFDKENFDMQVDFESSDGKEIKKGKILVINGRVMALQGALTDQGYEIAALDGTVFAQKFAIRLLGQSLPNGPAEIEDVRKIDFADANTGIQVSKRDAELEFIMGPPWRLKGEIQIISKDIVKYTLMLTFGEKEFEISENLVGKLSKAASTKINDALPLDGWKLYSVGKQSQKEGTTTAYEAIPDNTTYKTIAEIRKRLVDEAYLEEPDLSKNPTVFWKKKCKDAFGLQIMPYGTNGKYSVVFCEPAL